MSKPDILSVTPGQFLWNEAGIKSTFNLFVDLESLKNDDDFQVRIVKRSGGVWRGHVVAKTPYAGNREWALFTAVVECTEVAAAITTLDTDEVEVTITNDTTEETSDPETPVEVVIEP